MEHDPGDLSGTAFLAPDVAALYTHRPPYPADVYRHLAAHAPALGRLLDLGCGEGKIARPMAQLFDHVVAVDPSANMIAVGQSLENGSADNIDWVCAKAEDAPLTGLFDVVTFASSIHWMDPERLFARLGPHLAPDHRIAIVVGDEPFDPPWHAAWEEFLARWVPKVTGRAAHSDDWQALRHRHVPYVTVMSEQDCVSDPIEQTIESFIQCQYSRNTFTRAKLGDQVTAFQDDLRALLTPHQDSAGLLSYRVSTRLTLAQLKTA